MDPSEWNVQHVIPDGRPSVMVAMIIADRDKP
jgi:hypothetical protein